MTKQEWIRLYGYYSSQRTRQSLGIDTHIKKGKRNVRNRGKAIGQVLRNSSIKSEVRLMEE